MRAKKRTQADKREGDPNVLASFIVGRVTSPPKNPAAVALGRLGGIKGGPARAQKLSAMRRKEIASKAARSRWSRQQHS